MKNPIIILFAFGLWACSHETENHLPEQTNQPAIETPNEKYNSIHLQINNPTVLDSSDWIMYPLTLKELEETEAGFSSSYYERSQAFWNVAFYNTETKETRLLSDALKMVIYSITPKSGDSKESGQRHATNESLIYYAITMNDFNMDGKLTEADPSYLFVSTLSGTDFKQISPSDFDVFHWHTINNGKKILLQTRTDSDNNKVFDDDDEIVSFIYDLEAQTLEEVFGADFNLKTKKLQEKLWTKKV